MNAIIVTGGKQYKVAEGDVVYIEKLDQEAGDTVMADRLMTEALATNDLSVDEKAEGLSQFVSTLYTDSANVARAFPMIEALLAQEPDNTAILRLRAAVEDELKMSKDLEKTMRHILEIEPQSKSIWEQLMLELIDAKDYDAAKKVYDDAVATLEEKDPTRHPGEAPPGRRHAAADRAPLPAHLLGPYARQGAEGFRRGPRLLRPGRRQPNADVR